MVEVPDNLLALDQEEIEKIEHALQSEQARQLLLSGILGQGTEAEAALNDLLDPDLTGGCIKFNSINFLYGKY